MTGADIERGLVDINGSKQITKEKASNLRVGIAQEGDLLLTHKGTMGKTAVVPPTETPFIVVNPQITIYRVNPRGSLDTRFLKYFFDSPRFQEYLNRISSTSTVSTLSITNQKRLEILCLPIEDQRKIANILGNLDEKIKINQKATKALEGIAKTLFKSWFIDFDPSKAKKEGRSCGLPFNTSQLFPDSFYESPLGTVPSGWKILSLKEACSIISRGLAPKYCEQGGIPIVNQRCIRNESVDFGKARRHDISSKSIGKKTITQYDCLINSAGVGTLGRVAMTPDLMGEVVVVDPLITFLRGRNNFTSFYLSMLMLEKQEYLETLGEGSTGQTQLPRAVLEKLEIIMPQEEILIHFFEIISPLYKRKWSIERQCLCLEDLRIAILPKLISGDLKIPDLEKMLDEADI